MGLWLLVLLGPAFMGRKFVPILQDIVLLSSSLCVYPRLCVSGGEVVTTASREADDHCVADIVTAGIATDNGGEDGPTEVSDHL